MKKYCYRCHGEKFNGSAKFNVLDREGLLGGAGEPYVVPGKPDQSELWKRIADGEMPPEDEVQPSAAEKAVIEKWVLAGAPREVRPERPLKREEDILNAIRTDLQSLREPDQRFQRYFTLTHLFNNNRDVTDFDLRLVRAAFSKAINSISWKPDIVVPKPIDPEQTILRVDLRDAGLDEPGRWSSILERYPYGLRFTSVDDQQLVNLDRQAERLSGTPLAYVRADWFAVTATRPPLYHTLLQLPMTARELEAKLNVESVENFLQGRQKRAGLVKSGVSPRSHRVVIRQPAAFGFYWSSEDFKPENPTGNLLKKPLGPKFSRNPFAELAYEHDGGEMIFGLPNGLQGYFLTNGKGDRIDEGPTEVVRDTKETSGSVAIVNGLSCMHCHQHGMIPFEDAVRAGAGVFGAARDKVRELYIEPHEMAPLLERDSKRFLTALDLAIGPFLKTAEDKDKPIEEFAEPIGAIARFHQRDVTLEVAALELGFTDITQLQAAIKTNAHLKKLGLGPLMNRQTIKRSDWESREFGTSPFQEAARVLERGSPYIRIGTE